MARIRTIKPEFPQSETIGALSRDARLLFIQIWTIVDDAGRARAAPQVLAGTLYPFDVDAPVLMEGWLRELEKAGCIRRYEVDSNRYLEVCNWRRHQKIDRPSPSRLPGSGADKAPDPGGSPAIPIEHSASPREPSRALDAGPRTGDRDHGPDDHSGANAPAVAAAPPDARRRLFREGVELIEGLTGKPPDKCRAFIGALLRDLDDDCAAAMRILEAARSANPADPPAWIGAAVARERRRRPRGSGGGGGKLGYLARGLGIAAGGEQ